MGQPEDKLVDCPYVHGFILSLNDIYMKMLTFALLLTSLSACLSTSDTLSFREAVRPFLGKPYVAATLEQGAAEPLVVNTDSVDCTTFVEYVAASLVSGHMAERNDTVFRKAVERIRYRKGIRSGYVSRLHYFSEWILDNSSKDIVQEITSASTATPLKKEIDFMSTHPEAYPVLARNKNLVDSIRSTEKLLNNRPVFYIPKEELREKETLIREGDIIAIVTNIGGLDISHVGFAVLEKGRIHLLHASQKHKKVLIDPLPLTDYLKQYKSQIGIRIIRINFHGNENKKSPASFETGLL